MTDVEVGRPRPLVLIAEDDPDVRELIARKLRGEGMDVMGVGDGISALEAARTMRPDLVLLDVMMPGMTGLQICEELRSHVATRNLPVVLITARARAVDIETGYLAGADDYIVKPFSPRDLVARIRTGLRAVRS
ncbi:MAG TPA: response regulator [Actinomycetes bacterium]|jgi:DNA-binding response OmpR family regulator